jgi:Protein of unknown function (DUF2971)
MPPDKLPQHLYHYTDANGLNGILSSETLWATHVGYLNDSREVLHGAAKTAKYIDKIWADIEKAPEQYPDNFNAIKLLFDDIREKFPALIEPMMNRHAGMYVTCFCKDGDLLSQWRGYGGDGGYAIKFDAAKLRESLKRLPEKPPEEAQISDQVAVIEVKYDNERLEDEIRGVVIELSKALQHEKVVLEKDFMNPKRGAVDLALAKLVGLSGRVKDHAFREEKEFRASALVPFSPTNDAMEACHYYPGKVGLVPRTHLSFAQDSVKAIVVGPGDFSSTRKASVEHFLLTHPQYQDVKVKLSKIPFRSMR